MVKLVSMDKNEKCRQIITKAAEDINAVFEQPEDGSAGTNSEKAQDDHQAVLTLFQTTCKNGMILSLNSAPDKDAEGN